jgi:ribonucleoside-triphosphate reductase
MTEDFKLIEEYLANHNWRISENSNTTYSFSGLKSYLDSHILADFALSKLPEEIRKAHKNGDFHIHNLESGNLIRYCSGNSLQMLLLKGLWTPSLISKPAKHFSAVVDHVMNYLYMIQMETAGAVAFNDVDTLLAPFIRHDKLDFNHVKQDIQRLIFNLNFTLRSASQTPFSNVSLNFGVPKYLKNSPAIIGGEVKDNPCYSDYEKEIEMFDIAFSEILMDRDGKMRPFTFPIPTINLTKAINWDSEAIRMMLIEDITLGSFYFMNYIGSGISEETVRAMCCRLNIDTSELSSAGGLWNMGDSTGSLGVVTLNLARIGYLSKTEDEIYERLTALLKLAVEELLIKEQMIRKGYEAGLSPFSEYYDLNLDHYFRTIGIVGLNELCLNFTGKGLIDNAELGYKILSFLRGKIKEIQKETKKLFNLEMTPAEGSSYRLAKKDLEKYANIKTLGTKEAPYYTSLLIPPSEAMDVWERLKIEEKLLPLFSGGTVFRVFVGDETDDINSVKKLIQTIAASKIPYFDITRTFSVCAGEGKFYNGEVEICPSCGKRTEVFSRVVGYYRPVNKWNIGKQQEFKERKYVKIGG